MNTTFDIRHRATLDVDWLVQHYTKKDGVPVKYVCTTALDSGTGASDIFYRDTPHPDFGNKYFGVFAYNGQAYIHNADSIEDLDFVMLDTDFGYHYSQHRHDMFTIDGMSIDGGRAYTRTMGPLVKTKTFWVRNGEFVECGQ